jgi:peroxiredoxin
MRLPVFAKSGVAVVAISPDQPGCRAGLPAGSPSISPLLADADLRVARLFGLAYAPPWPASEWGRLLGLDGEWPLDGALLLPAAYLIDPDATARAAFVSANPAWRAEPADVLAAV